ncbi:uncharacterized protein LOC114127148 [Aphis gossypii]|nr:uncharacterized protein LOC114127148 [Aphis gossypii]
MSKITIAVLVQVAVFFVMQVSVDSCNDKIIKDMMVSICGMNIKRSFSDNSNRGSLFGLNLRGMLGDTERDFKRLVEDTVEADWQLKKSYEHKPKESNVSPLQRPIHLSRFKDSSRHMKTRDDSGKAVVIKREIMMSLKECCLNKNCSITDFRLICEKK